MPLVEHLRELRRRLAVSFLAIIVVTVVAWFFYQQIFAFIAYPAHVAEEQARADGRDLKLVLSGVADAFMLQVKISLLVGVIVASPVWIYQIWRFITPGLYRNERRYAVAFVGTAVPLFLAGAAVGYWVLPKGLNLLFGFTPVEISNYVSVDAYLSFTIRMILVFAFGFLAPVVVVGMNLAGVLSARQLRRSWRWIIIGTLVFAAVATPSGDPWTMTLLAAPLLVMMLVAYLITLLTDRRRARRAAADGLSGLSDDEASPLDPTPSDLTDYLGDDR